MAIIQGNAKKSTVSGFYPKTIEGSLRFNDDDSADLRWTPDSAGNRKTWTVSFWMKDSGKTSGDNQIFYAGTSSSNVAAIYRGGSNGTLNFYNYAGAVVQWNIATNQVFRDPSAWYHIVAAVDTTQATDSNRIKIYVNGEQVTSLATATYPSQNTDGLFNYTNEHYIGSNRGTSFFDGYLAEVFFIDGTAHNADAFGETKNGVWVPKNITATDFTMGTNGFHLTFQDDTEVEAFNTVLYRANNNNGQSVTGMGFQPDLVWIKQRTTAVGHNIEDSVRGAGKFLQAETTAAEDPTGNLISFDSDGFTVGTGNRVDQGTNSYVAWGWKAGGAPTVDNSAGAGSVPTAGSVKIDGVNFTSALAGSLPAIRLSASTTYGFSIVTWQANNQTVGTVAHGLGVAPDFVIIKNRDSSTNAQWVIGHSAFGFTGQGYLNLTAGFGTNSGSFNNTAPTSDVFTVGTDQTVNLGTNKYIGYCWAETSGYSKIDGYSGSTSEITVYTTDDGTASGANPFKPALVFIKRSDSDTDAYSLLFDNTRDVEGDNGRHLFADLTNGESDSAFRKITFNDNGFTIPASASADPSVNAGSSSTYVYAAFADTREAAFWLDQSGNDNDWQPVNLDHNDTVADSPTDNFPTLNPVASFNGDTLSEGNLQQKTNTYVVGYVPSTIAMPSGQWYAEVTYVTDAGNTNGVAGIAKITSPLYSNDAYYSTEAYVNFSANGQKYTGGSGTAYGSVWNNDGDVLGIAFDADNGDLYFSVNGEWQDSTDGTFANATPAFSGLSTDTSYYFVSGGYGGGANTTYATTMRWNFGQQPFKYDPPA